MVDHIDPGKGPTERKVPQGLTSDYSKIATRYDATRDLPDQQLIACYDRLIEQGMFPVEGKILDAGCGPGQVSLPLAARGYDVRGIDISKEMTMLAQATARSTWKADYSVADVRSIPAEENSFDAAVVSKLFQHVQDWREACRELIRVVRPGCCISYGEALGRIREGLFAEFWRLPRAIFDRRTADTLAWIEVQPNGRDTIERLRPYLVVEVFRTPCRC